jgi:hypothetical protein
MTTKLQFAWLPALALATMLTSGCAYLGNRTHDALDMVDLGITINPEPGPEFSLYADFFSVLPIGYANVDGFAIGIGNRQIGIMRHEYKNWGLLVAGSEKKGSGKFNPADPHQARPDQRDLTERPRFANGLLRLPFTAEPPPGLQFLEADRGYHLGWIGVFAAVRPVDIIDFVLGFATIDILGDDICGLEPQRTPPPANVTTTLRTRQGTTTTPAVRRRPPPARKPDVVTRMRTAPPPRR